MFKPWPKITRLENKRPPVFTEKIDGTNACVILSFQPPDKNTILSVEHEAGLLSIWAQSRTRLITPENDNYGFAKWVKSNSEELLSLGDGYHFGEWWGQGIQRGYGLTEKRFSLFNTRRWGPHNPNTPKCCHVVPIIPVLEITPVLDSTSRLSTRWTSSPFSVKSFKNLLLLMQDLLYRLIKD